MINQFDKNSQSVQWLLNELLNKTPSADAIPDSNFNIGSTFYLPSDVLVANGNAVNMDSVNSFLDYFFNTYLPEHYSGNFLGFIDVLISFPSDFINDNFLFIGGAYDGMQPTPNQIIHNKFERGTLGNVINPDNQTFNLLIWIKKDLIKLG